MYLNINNYTCATLYTSQKIYFFAEGMVAAVINIDDKSNRKELILDPFYYNKSNISKYISKELGLSYKNYISKVKNGKFKFIELNT